jgi:hypothetical protein
VEKSRLNWFTQFLTVHTMVRVSPMLLLDRHEFPSAPCLAGKKLDGSRFDVVEIARHLTCFVSASVTSKVLHFGQLTHPLSNDTIDSVLRHRKVGRAIDLSAPSYCAPLVFLLCHWLAGRVVGVVI